MVLLSLKDKHIQQEPCKPERSLQCQAITGNFIVLENHAFAYYSKLLFTFILSLDLCFPDCSPDSKTRGEKN